ncbi:MAG: ABC transporter ATP-binding protein [Anaerolineales bacterium]
MIETIDLSKDFDGVWAVDGLNLTVSTGQILALLGPNGAGKTTTIRMLTTILKPSRGKATIMGYDILTQAEEVRAHVGVLTEQHGLYPRMRAREYLEFFGNTYKMKQKILQNRIEELLFYFGLNEAQDKRLGQYSKGMRQKLALARALIHDPTVLLLDEPTSAMDPASARLVRNAIQQLRSKDRAIVICTHNLAEAEELADQIAIIQQGRLILQGSPAELKRRLTGKEKVFIHFLVNEKNPPPKLDSVVKLVEMGKDYLVYETDQPEQVTPVILEQLIQQGLRIYSVERCENSLEEVYLNAVANSLRTTNDG